MGGGGFDADKRGMADLAGALHQDAVQVRGYVTSMRGLQCPSADLLGQYGGVDAAYGRFLNSWADEFTITADALDQLSTKVRESAATYHVIDEKHQAGFDHGLRAN